MLPIRRVVPSASSLASAALPKSAAAAAPVFARGHQRRCSSSKPSRSDNGTSGIVAGPSVPASARPQGKSTGEKRKRKGKDDTTQSTKLPSVPSTQHMAGERMQNLK